MSRTNHRNDSAVAFRQSVLTFALVVSSLLVTGLKLAFRDPKQLNDSRSRPAAGPTPETRTAPAADAQRRTEPEPSRRARSARRRRSHPDRGTNLDCIHEAVPATLEDHDPSLDVPLAAVALPPAHRSTTIKARSQSDLTLRRTNSFVSDTSSEGTTASGRESWAMEEVCGHLQKQGDVLGLWKQRFFRLAAFESYELDNFPDLPKGIISADTHRRFLLLYWSCDARMAMTGAQRLRPRGAFLLSNCSVATGNDAANSSLILHNLVNAMNPQAPVPPMRLKASDARRAHRWMSALTFASIAESFPRTGFDQLRTYPMPDLCETLGVVASPATGQVLCNFYFRLYKAYESPAAADAAAAASSDDADDADLVNTFLLSWDSEKQAVSKPIAAQSMYDLAAARATVTDTAPGVITLQGVKNLLPVNMHRSNGMLYLKAPSQALANAWARAIDPRCKLPETLCTSESALHLGRGAAKTVNDGDDCVESNDDADDAKDTRKRRASATAAPSASAETLVDELTLSPSLTTMEESAPSPDASNELEVDSLSCLDILNAQQSQVSEKVEDSNSGSDHEYDDDDAEEEDQDENVDIDNMDSNSFVSPSRRKPSHLNSEHLQAWQSPRPEKLSPVMEEAETPGSTTSRASRVSRASQLSRIR
ncbi:Hypothetical Protein FCC1311_035152 [Hondaea fermentalgiana]|uniref:PH domain-containing protein n=1 Tax=Hondaea fermentalgiana TaxID=2315210 RepID=A0A2R5GF98_9STRA|nr:Hypothetical Protein FCC1311_035152 [Hondaea fermentalgiana]|eukprot:GBG27293.1 Hypothetical Protein FCC1311_035152 [Hondaea fermentalgiana]